MEFILWSPSFRKPVRLILREYDMDIIIGDQAQVIPYAYISNIRLGRRKKVFFIQIITVDYGAYMLHSTSDFIEIEPMLQERAYNLFVRILHLHLQTKSTALFYIGFSLTAQCRKIGVIALLAVLLFFIEDYNQFIGARALLLSSIVFLISSLLMLAFQFNKWPKNYEPANIPSNMLPTAS